MKKYGEPILPVDTSEAAPNARGQFVDVLFGGCGYGVGPFRRPVPPPKPSLFSRLGAWLGLSAPKAAGGKRALK